MVGMFKYTHGLSFHSHNSSDKRFFVCESVLHVLAMHVTSNPGFPFRILSHSFGEKSEFHSGFYLAALEKNQNSIPDFISQLWRKIRIRFFHQSCETKSRIESLGSRLTKALTYMSKIRINVRLKRTKT